MNLPDTDPFYDALRNRLHDYEEPLPSKGWAGIASQLPAAPARPLPWWRRPLRRRLGVLALLLLVLPAAVLLWLRATRPGTGPAHARLAAHSGSQPAPGKPTVAADGPPTRNAAAGPLAAGSTPRPGSTSAAPRPAAPASEPQAALPAPAVARRRPVVRLAPVARGAKRRPAQSGLVVAPDSIAAPGSASEPLTGPTPTPAARRQRRGKGMLVLAPVGPNPALPGTPAAAAGDGAGQATSAPAAGSAGAAPESTTSTPVPGSTMGSATSAALAPLALSSPTANGPAASAQSLPTTGAADTLAGRAVALLLLPADSLPHPLPFTSPADSLRRPRPARLSLGLLLGLSPTRRGAGGVPEPLARAEAPGLASSAELAVGYQLRGPLRLRAGAGYLVQRQQLAFTVEKRSSYWVNSAHLIVRNNPGGPDTLQVLGYAQRDTVLGRQRQQYQLAQHYLTLPLAAEWRFRTPFRWQPVLSLGASASWLLQGRYLATDAGSRATVATQRGGGPGPFRPSSLTLSAGLGLDYALGLRSTLLLRPAASYGLTPSSRAGGRRAAAVGLQVGLLFDAHR